MTSTKYDSTASGPLHLMLLVLDGEATPQEREALEALLAADASARAEFAQLQALAADLRALPQPYPPEGLVASVSAALPQYRKNSSPQDQLISVPGVFATKPPSQTPRRSVSMSQRKSLFANRKTWMGAGVAAAALVVVTQIDFKHFPPQKEDLAGTVVPAQRYRATQGTEDIKLGDQSVTQLLQNDAFVRMAKDPEVRKLALDPGFEAAGRWMAANPEAAKVLLANPQVSQFFLANQEASRGLVLNAEAARGLLLNAEAAQRLLNSPEAAKFFEQNPQAAKVFTLNAEAARNMLASPEAMIRLLNSPEAAKGFLANSEAALKILNNPEAAKFFLSNGAAADFRAKNAEAAKYLLANPEAAKAFLSNAEASKVLLANPEAAKFLLANPQAASFFTANAEAAKLLLASPEAARNMLANPEAQRNMLNAPAASMQVLYQSMDRLRQ